MADRRMFSKRIINSARFLTMPLSTQALYFHLGLNADDDGVVEGFMVMRQVGATQDDLRILVVKGFITLLNDDLVAYIMDWRENNKIRADRKTDSIYKELLLQVLPNVDLLSPRQRADVKKTSDGRPEDNQLSANGPHRIGKDSIGQISVASSSYSPSSQETDDKDDDKWGYIVRTWNENMLPITPLVGEKLKDLCDEVGCTAVELSIKAAAEHGARNFAYVQACARNIAAGNGDKKKELLF